MTKWLRIPKKILSRKLVVICCLVVLLVIGGLYIYYNNFIKASTVYSDFTYTPGTTTRSGVPFTSVNTMKQRLAGRKINRLVVSCTQLSMDIYAKNQAGQEIQVGIVPINTGYRSLPQQIATVKKIPTAGSRLVSGSSGSRYYVWGSIQQNYSSSLNACMSESISGSYATPKGNFAISFYKYSPSGIYSGEFNTNMGKYVFQFNAARGLYLHGNSPTSSVNYLQKTAGCIRVNNSILEAIAPYMINGAVASSGGTNNISLSIVEQ